MEITRARREGVDARTVATARSGAKSLGGPTSLPLRGAASLQWVLQESGCQQPQAARIDRWATKEAISKATSVFPGLHLADRLAAFWRGWDYHPDDSLSVVQERGRNRYQPQLIPDSVRTAPIVPTIRYWKVQRVANLRSRAKWERCPLMPSKVRIDMSAMDKHVDTTRTHKICSRSGLTTIESLRSDVPKKLKSVTIETPLLAACLSHLDSTAAEALSSEVASQKANDRADAEVLHWDLTTELGLILGATDYCSSSPLLRDPAIPRFYDLREKTPFSSEGQPTAAVIILQQHDNSDRTWMMADEAACCLVCVRAADESRAEGLRPAGV